MSRIGSRPLKIIALPVFILVLLLSHLGDGAESPVFSSVCKAKHIILFIGDGMQLEHEVAASRYLYGRDDGLIFHNMSHWDVTTWDVTTYDHFAKDNGWPRFDPHFLNPLIGYDPSRGGSQPYPVQRAGIDDNYFVNPNYATDSASAATAIATGNKTEDGNISWLPGDPTDGRLPTIAELLRQKKGFAIGIASTVPFNHATPAAFVSHNKSRKNYFEIANEIIRDIKPDVVLGGGHPSWTKKYVPETLLDEVKMGRVPDYVFVEREIGKNGTLALMMAAERAVQNNKKLFGLFGGSEGNIESSEPLRLPDTPLVRQGSEENPLLKDMTIAGLKVLSKNPDGFIFVVEQGDIDWANGDNDYARMVGTVADLDRAVRAAIEYVDIPGDEMNWENTLLIVTADHGTGYMRLTDKEKLGPGILPVQVRGRCPDTLASTCWTYPNGEVSYRITEHTNELVRLYAEGCGVKYFHQYEGRWYPNTRIIDNTHIFNVIAEAAGINDRSPLPTAPSYLNDRDPKKNDRVR